MQAQEIASVCVCTYMNAINNNSIIEMGKSLATLKESRNCQSSCSEKSCLDLYSGTSIMRTPLGPPLTALYSGTFIIRTPLGPQ